jgi:hypothetical protein
MLITCEFKLKTSLFSYIFELLEKLDKLKN